MKRLFSLVVASALPLTAAAQEYSNGGTGQKGRGPAIESPVDTFGINPPLKGSADDYPCCPKCALCTPYYAPLSPTPTFSRWCSDVLVPYYCGYCSHRHFRPKPPPYGWDGACGVPPPGAEVVEPGSPAYTFGVYTGAGTDEKAFWNMGGNGSVPYNAPPPPRSGPPDIVDMIQASRGRGPCPVPHAVAAPPIHEGVLPATPPAADGTAR
jgi:hypothetical protein